MAPLRRRQHGIRNVLLSHPYGMDVVYLKMRLLKMQIFHILLPHNIYAMAGWNARTSATIHCVCTVYYIQYVHTIVGAYNTCSPSFSSRMEWGRAAGLCLTVKVCVLSYEIYVCSDGTITTVCWMLILLQTLAIIVTRYCVCATIFFLHIHSLNGRSNTRDSLLFVCVCSVAYCTHRWWKAPTNTAI